MHVSYYSSSRWFRPPRPCSKHFPVVMDPFDCSDGPPGTLFLLRAQPFPTSTCPDLRSFPPPDLTIKNPFSHYQPDGFLGFLCQPAPARYTPPLKKFDGLSQIFSNIRSIVSGAGCI